MWNQATLLNTTVGPYHLVDFLGAGGMGEVYRAVHASNGRVVAVKVLATPNPNLIARFHNEAQVHARLRHPHIVQLYDVLDIDGQPALVMEYVDGEALDARLRRTGPLPVAEALSIFRAVVDAIDAIHQHGIVHRDVKTGNVKLTATGQVKLLDFGIAKHPDEPGLTKTGAVVGTPECLAPEQVRGHDVSPATDIWALGVLLYELVTAHPPFEAEDSIALYQKIDEAAYLPPSVVNPTVSPTIDAIVGRCLRRNPAHRYSSTAALHNALGRAPVSPAALPPALSLPLRWMKRLRRSIARSDPRPSTPLVRSTTAFLAALRQKLHLRPMFVGVGVVALGLLLYALALSGPNRPPDEAPLHELTIRVAGSPATVYVNGERRGTTPYRLRAPIGAPVELELRRAGSRPKVVHFTMPSTRSTFQETLTPLP